MSQFDAVVFDLDGTLCRRDQDLGAAYRAAFDRAGVEPFGEPAALWAALDGPPDPDDRVGYLAAGFARLAARECREVDPIALAEAFVDDIDDGAVGFLPDAEATLDRVGDRTAVGLLTNGPESRQGRKVAALGLDPRVESTVYAGDLPRRKPTPAPFRRVLADLEARPAASLYVGDSLAYDVAGAHAAGMEAAWLRDGASPDPYHPEYVLDSLSTLPAVVDDPEAHRRADCCADR